MIKLYQFPAMGSLPNSSPFCLKLETYLRMANLSFEIVVVGDPRKSPKGKLPSINDHGHKLSDSGFIIDYLQEKYDVTLDKRLTEEQKAEALALRRMLEEHLYWVIVYSRWLDARCWPITKKLFLGSLKFPLSLFLPRILQKKIARDLYAHGIGRHSEAEIYQLGIADLKALSVLLKPEQFYFGSQASSIDACIYAMLASILYSPIPSPLQEYAQSQAHFITYCERMKSQYFD